MKEDELRTLAAKLRSPTAIDYSMGVLSAADLGWGYRDLVDLAHIYGTALDERSPSEVANELVPGASEAIRRAVPSLLDAYERELTERLDALDVDNLDVEALQADPWQLLEVVGGPGAAVMLAAAMLEVDDPLEAGEYLRAYSSARQKRSREEQMYRSIFVMAVGMVESAVGDVVRRESMHNGGFAHLDPELDRRVRRATSGGPALWGEKVAELLGWDPTASVVQWAEFIDLYALRNLFVHRRGIIDEAYRAAVPDSPEVGNTILLCTETTKDAIDLSEGIARTIRLAAWARAEPAVTNDLVETYGSTEPLMLLDRGRPRVAEVLAQWAASLRPGEEVCVQAQVNAWLARSTRLGLESVSEPVRRWDAAALGDEYVLARHMLLDELDEAVVVLDRLRATGRSDESFGRWVLLDALRERGDLAPRRQRS